MNVMANGHPCGMDGDFPGGDRESLPLVLREIGLTEPSGVSTHSHHVSLDGARTLVQPLQRFSVESFTRTVCPLTALMLTVARRILGDEVQAWDAVQEAMIALWNEEEVPPNPRAWLTRAVVLRSLHLARCRTRRRWHERRACERRPEASVRD